MATYNEAETVRKVNPIPERPDPNSYKNGRLKGATALNVRLSPQKTASVLFVLREGTPFIFRKTDINGWYAIVSAGSSTAGWAMAEYIEEVPGDVT